MEEGRAGRVTDHHRLLLALHLEHVDFLDEQVETRMQRLLSLVEPMMLVFMGVIIAILLVSIYLPMFSMLGSTKF